MSSLTELSMAFIAQDFVDELAASPTVLRLAARVLRDASIDLNNSAIMLPQEDWHSARSVCDALDELSEAFTRGVRP